jgi:hypothetical protein
MILCPDRPMSAAIVWVLKTDEIVNNTIVMSNITSSSRGLRKLRIITVFPLFSNRILRNLVILSLVPLKHDTVHISCTERAIDF